MTIEKDSKVVDAKEAIKIAMAEIKAEQDAERKVKEDKEFDVKAMVKELLAEKEVKEVKVVKSVVIPEVKVVKTNKYGYAGKLKCYKDTELEAAYDEGMWFKATQLNDTAAKAYCVEMGIETKDMSGDASNAAGGYTVPNQLLARVITLASEYGIVRANSDVLQANSDTLWIPKRASNVSIGWQAAQNDEKDDSDIAYEQVEVLIRQLYVLTKLSNQLISDSVINMIDYVVQGMAEALAQEEDRVCLQGNGIAADGLITGIVPAIIDVGDDNDSIVDRIGHAWADLELADFNVVMGRLADYAWNGREPQWTCSNNFYHSVMNRIKGEVGSTWSLESKFSKQFLGYEVITTPMLAVTENLVNPSIIEEVCMFGRYDQVAAFANRTATSVKTSTEGEAFRKNQLHIRAEQRFGYTVHDQGSADAAGSMILLRS